jgi:hypothetical protein
MAYITIKFSILLKIVCVYCDSVCWLLVTDGVAPSSPILVTLMKEALSSSETSVLTRATRRNIPEDTIIHSHRHENLKSYITVIGFHIITNTKQGREQSYNVCYESLNRVNDECNTGRY